MEMTLAEKVLARTSGKPTVTPGEIVDARPDLVMSHLATWRSIAQLRQVGVDKLWDPDRIAVVLDHRSPANTIKDANDHRLVREFVKSHGIKTFYDTNEGIAHLVLMEKGHVKPGMLILGTDSHTPIYGGLGAFGTGVGFTEVTSVWLTGEVWLKVPTSVKITLSGSFPKGVFGKDLMLRLIGDLGANGCTYKSVEFCGDCATKMSVSERMTLCNMATELGAKCAFVEADAVTDAYLKEHGARDYELVTADPDAVYESDSVIAVSELEPMVACPHEVENTKPVSSVAGTKINQGHFGSCVNAKYEDLETFANILRGNSVHPDIRLIMTPGSRDIYTRAAQNGLIAILAESGALITNPGCGACAGDGGFLGDGEVALSTANRNFQGRMGSNKAEVYLCSPATLAASVIRGEITDPREFMD
jgi:homoaconitate hydratase family protein